MQNQTNAKHSSNRKGIFKSAKCFLEKLNPKEDSSITTISKVPRKVLNRKKTSKQQYNFWKDMISLEVHDMGSKIFKGEKISRQQYNLCQTKICSSSWHVVRHWPPLTPPLTLVLKLFNLPTRSTLSEYLSMSMSLNLSIQIQSLCFLFFILYQKKAF